MFLQSLDYISIYSYMTQFMHATRTSTCVFFPGSIKHNLQSKLNILQEEIMT